MSLAATHLIGFGARRAASQSSSLLTSGSSIGNMTDAGGLAAAFDSTTNAAYTSAAQTNNLSGDAFVGKDWGSGVTKTITEIKWYGPNNLPIAYNGVGNSRTMKIQGSADNSNWTDLWTGSCGTGNSDLVNPTSGITTTTAYRYHRVTCSSGGATWTICCVELQFYGY